MEEILHHVDMVDIPLFTGFHTCWVVVGISAINSMNEYDVVPTHGLLDHLQFQTVATVGGSEVVSAIWIPQNRWLADTKR